MRTNNPLFAIALAVAFVPSLGIAHPEPHDTVPEIVAAINNGDTDIPIAAKEYDLGTELTDPISITGDVTLRGVGGKFVFKNCNEKPLFDCQNGLERLAIHDAVFSDIDGAVIELPSSINQDVELDIRRVEAKDFVTFITTKGASSSSMPTISGVIEDVTLDPNNRGVCIYLVACGIDKLSINRCHFKNTAKAGIQIGKADEYQSDRRRISITNCTFEDGTQAADGEETHFLFLMGCQEVHLNDLRFKNLDDTSGRHKDVEALYTKVTRLTGENLYFEDAGWRSITAKGNLEGTTSGTEQVSDSVSLRNVYIRYSDAYLTTHSEAGGIFLSGSHHCTCRDVEIRGGRVGITVEQSPTTESIPDTPGFMVVDNCRIHDQTDYGIYGKRVFSNFVVRGNYCYNAEDDGIRVLAKSDDVAKENIFILDNYVEGPDTDYGITIVTKDEDSQTSPIDAKNIVVLDNVITNVDVGLRHTDPDSNTITPLQFSASDQEMYNVTTQYQAP